MDDELLEVAARKLCHLRGIDPDATYDFAGFNKNWTRAAREVKPAMELHIAISHALTAPSGQGD